MSQNYLTWSNYHKSMNGGVWKIHKGTRNGVTLAIIEEDISFSEHHYKIKTIWSGVTYHSAKNPEIEKVKSDLEVEFGKWLKSTKLQPMESVKSEPVFCWEQQDTKLDERFRIHKQTLYVDGKPYAIIEGKVESLLKPVKWTVKYLKQSASYEAFGLLLTMQRRVLRFYIEKHVPVTSK